MAVHAWDAWRIRRAGPAAILARQQARLRDLVAFARARSPFYCERYRHLPPDVGELSRLPPVTKPELMASFDAWVTDPGVTRAGVDEFMADPRLVGRRHLGRYVVWSSSGITGFRGIYLHDPEAFALYRALTFARGWLPWMTPRRLWATVRRGNRVAAVVITGRHHGGVAMFAAARRDHPWPFDRVRVFSPLRPLAEVVAGLNAFQPAMLMGYPDSLLLLSREQVAGRLAIRPAFIGCGGDWLAPSTRHVVAAAFGCRVRENYGTSEFPPLGTECRAGRIHLAADWAILEPVDDRYRPVPPGEASHTALLTNLANRVQPFVRYELGDRVTAGAAPCPCGSPLPHVRVEGRRDDLLRFPAPDGATGEVLPLTLTSTVVDTPGVNRYQVIQTGPKTLRVRLEATPPAAVEEVAAAVAARVRAYLKEQGVPDVHVARDPQPPAPDPVSGKFRRVWAEPAARAAVPPALPGGSDSFSTTAPG
jgi:phenylacetate-coenzyme A ligase PaaK-like adenylate-forming protein